MNQMFDEDYQLYEAWNMNLVEFTNWVSYKVDQIGYDEFNEKYPSFHSAYQEYIEMIKN